ncbi:MAG TPA: FAD-dependent oxidoreductase [Chthoniobacterales bacterium]|jgi:D-amino-acid oxidase|nr:FAD-dependent oxidoreductase [Chthoniobacterales bacterium]
MKRQVAIIGAGVSGLTCAAVLAEQGYEAAVLASETGDQTNSAAAAAIWYPYDVGPGELVVPWALISYGRFCEIARDPGSGVSLVEQRVFSRLGPISPPAWAQPFATRTLAATELPDAFVSGFSIRVPLIETGKYLAYLAARLTSAGGSVVKGRCANLIEVDRAFDVVINCAGIGARQLVPDHELEPHRGQVAVVAKLDLPYAVVSDDPPLMYAIPRSDDCVLGGTNEVSENRRVDPLQTRAILKECERILGRPAPPLLRERVGLRPCRKSGVRVAREKLGDGRTAIHNYGHGGAGFTLSWGCAQTVLELVRER